MHALPKEIASIDKISAFINRASKRISGIGEMDLVAGQVGQNLVGISVGTVKRHDNAVVFQMGVEIIQRFCRSHQTERGGQSVVFNGASTEQRDGANSLLNGVIRVIEGIACKWIDDVAAELAVDDVVILIIAAAG